jgi:hypothetical protein
MLKQSTRSENEAEHSTNNACIGECREEDDGD